jgi:hypothetical protein
VRRYSSSTGHVDVSVIDLVLPPQDITGKSVVISGSRGWRFPTTVTRLVRTLSAAGVKEIVVGYDPVRKTPRGVDQMVWDACRVMAAPVKACPANWVNGDKINYGAGIKRNIEMVNGADLLIACWELVDGPTKEPSRGTAHAIVYAHQVGKLYRIFSPPDREQNPEKLLRLAYSVRGLKFPEKSP